MQPKEIKRRGTEGIDLLWEDGTKHFISSRCLRVNCPAADSRAEREGAVPQNVPTLGKLRLMVVDSKEEEQIRLEKIWLVGNYALGMRWGDGHDTGIYPYKLLFELGEQEFVSSAE